MVASLLAKYLPKKRILLIEGGPTDVGDDRVLVLKDRIQTIRTHLDYDYTSVPQPQQHNFFPNYQVRYISLAEAEM